MQQWLMPLNKLYPLLLGKDHHDVLKMWQVMMARALQSKLQMFVMNQEQTTTVQALPVLGDAVYAVGLDGMWKIKRWRWGRALVLLWLEISVNYAQAVQMVEGQGQLCKVEFHIFLCKHNLIRTGHIYSLNSEEERHSAAKENTTAVLSFSNHKQRKQYYYCHSINISNRLQDSASCWFDTASNDCFVSETCFQHKVCLENNHTLSEFPESIWKEQIWASAWQAMDDWKANKDSKRSFVLPWGI